MQQHEDFDALIIGGSYAGLSAAMALGRSLRQVLIIDSGEPCNRFTPHAHNFLTLDGKSPLEISSLAKGQVSKYPSVHFHQGHVQGVRGVDGAFGVTTDEGESFGAKKLILATGIRDILPQVKGFAECWGKSVIHCPYCHGYEFRGRRTGIWASGEKALHLAALGHNLTQELILFPDSDTFPWEGAEKLESLGIRIVSGEIQALEHRQGILEGVVLGDGNIMALDALYASPPFEQSSDLPQALGCRLTPQGHIQVDMMQRSSVAGVYACGDNASGMRSLAQAVQAGNMAGAALNSELALAEFQ